MNNRRILSLLLIGLTVLRLIIPYPVLAGGTITITASGSQELIGGSGALAEAQSFTTPYSGTLTQFTFTLTSNSGTPTGTMTWQIMANFGGVLGPSIMSGTLTPTASATNTVNPVGLWLAAGTLYWLELKSTGAQTGTNGWRWQGAATSQYAFGNSLQCNGLTDAACVTPAFVIGDFQSSFTVTDSGFLTATPPNTPVPTATILPSSTPGVPTATEKPNPTGIPTSTPYIFIPVPTATEKPNPTPQPTFEDIDVPTATEKPNPTGIPTSTPNNTPVDTPTEINTPVDTPTEINTPVDTPTPVSCACVGGSTPTDTLTPTDTPTPSVTPTPTDTPTPTSTPTPTPNIIHSFPLQPGQDGAVIYSINGGEVAIFSILALIALLVCVLLYAFIRRR